MSESPGERRDIASTLVALQVGVTEIKTIQTIQTKTLDRLEDRLNIVVLRDEFNAFKVTANQERTELRKSVDDLTKAHSRQQGQSATWRLVSGALALLTLALAVVGVLRL